MLFGAFSSLFFVFDSRHALLPLSSSSSLSLSLFSSSPLRSSWSPLDGVASDVVEALAWSESGRGGPALWTRASSSSLPLSLAPRLKKETLGALLDDVDDAALKKKREREKEQPRFLPPAPLFSAPAPLSVASTARSRALREGVANANLLLTT